MKVRFKESFAKDLRALKDKALLARIRLAIEEVEKAARLTDVPGVRKLRGATPFYRIRVGDCRIGLAIEEDVIVFVRVLHRREVYRYFP